MALTREDLAAIKSIVDESVKDIKTDVKDLRTDVEGLKTDVKDLRTDVGGLKTDVKDLRTDVEGLKTSVSSLESDVSVLKDRVKKIEVVQLEKYLIPKVDEIASYQKFVYERYTKDADRFEEKISLIDSIEQTVKEHSIQIQEIKAKMA